MPIYEYKCNTCQAVREVYRQISERDNPYMCFDCTSTDTHRVVSPTANVTVGDMAMKAISSAPPGMQQLADIRDHGRTKNKHIKITSGE